MISKWQYVLERKNSGGNGEITSERLGLFLRLLHYYAISMLETETEASMLPSELKLCSTILSITPYARLLPGLSSQLTEAILGQLRDE